MFESRREFGSKHFYMIFSLDPSSVGKRWSKNQTQEEEEEKSVCWSSALWVTISIILNWFKQWKLTVNVFKLKNEIITINFLRMSISLLLLAHTINPLRVWIHLASKHHNVENTKKKGKRIEMKPRNHCWLRLLP